MLMPARTSRRLEAHFNCVMAARKSAMMGAYGSWGTGRAGLADRSGAVRGIIRVTWMIVLT
jgi:hypothetical protein